MIIELIPFQQTFRQPLSIIYGSIDYHEFKETLLRIEELLNLSGIEEKIMLKVVEKAIEDAEYNHLSGERKSSKLSETQQIHIQKNAQIGLRCIIIKWLRDLSFRKLSCQLAESQLLQYFCLLDNFGHSRIPSKSTLERFEKMLSTDDIRELVMELIQSAAEKSSQDSIQKLRLENEIKLADYYLDSTCVKGNIHYPVDWVLFRDATRTLMKAILLIRKHGLKHRIDDPNSFIKTINKLCMKMTFCYNKKDSKKQRKKILRKMKKLLDKIRNHGKRYRTLLSEKWESTKLTEKQANRIIERIDGVLNQIPEIKHQAHERIIGERLIKNEDKILSIYDKNMNVIVRKKMEAKVEFGNKLLLGEQADGIIMDWHIIRDGSPSDHNILSESLKRIKEKYSKLPKNISTDRGFYSKKNSKLLEKENINNHMCPKSVQDLKEKLSCKEFKKHQNRRSQTEARIGIFKNNFLGKPLRSKGFMNREASVAWAVLTHNLWVIARLPYVSDDLIDKAS